MSHSCLKYFLSKLAVICLTDGFGFLWVTTAKTRSMEVLEGFDCMQDCHFNEQVQ